MSCEKRTAQGGEALCTAQNCVQLLNGAVDGRIWPLLPSSPLPMAHLPSRLWDRALPTRVLLMRIVYRCSVPLVALAIACSGTEVSGPSAPADIEALSLVDQTATAGSAVAELPSVRVTDAKGNAVAGASVVFAVTSGGGTISGATQITGADGKATVSGWTVGTTAGGNTLQATVEGLAGEAVTFAATGVAGPATTLVIASSSAQNQSATAGAAVAMKPSVLAADVYSNPVSGVAITFSVTAGGGLVTGENQVTGSDGIATIGSWTVGTTVGTNTLTASAAGLEGSPVTFTATAVAGPASAMTKHAGDNQSATLGTNLTTNPAVKVTDANGNPVSGVSVTFAVSGGGGSITGATQVTGVDGTATVSSWTLGTTPGPNSLTATTSAVSTGPLTFTATSVGTPACGIISSSTTWTVAQSPIVAQCTIQLAYGATLTIDPGVQVLGRGQKLEVWGELLAVGTASDSIRFSDLHVVPRGRFSPLETFLMRIEHAVIQGGSVYAPSGNAIYGRIELRHSRVKNLTERFYVWYPEGKCYFERNVFEGPARISVGSRGADTVFIRNNYFTHGNAVTSWASYEGETIVLEGNTFADTTQVAVAVEIDGLLTAANNFWNTTSESVIASMIADKNDDLSRPAVIEFRPFLTSPHASTPQP